MAYFPAIRDIEPGQTIIKYCSGDAHDAMLGGSFWFGALRKYRGEETSVSDEVRFSDQSDGVLVQSVNLQCQGGTFELPGFEMNVAESGYINVNTCFFKETIDAYVFCASKGPYDPEHHEKILHGARYKNTERYSGNPSLTHYLEIDCLEILTAIDRLHKLNPAPRSSLIPVTDGAPVVYCNKSMDNSNLNGANFIPRNEQIWRAAYWKDPYYRIENEFRIILRPPLHFHGASLDVDFFKLKSNSLSRAIKVNGSIS